MENPSHKTSESLRQAVKRYEQKNAKAKQYRNKKSATKSFILNLATEEDLQLVEEWLKERENQGYHES
ncbi:hypothetical protein [Enterococcus casseliflavus]|uniref:hypothetical protein n=1 Tax=Enterococcus casseliflavus TaxID=37734 RepID=UPI00232BE132|nr:hypothetical protein [Enterococcus casseliflavus]MDB1689042.1 hypothetical protein [Enterococcus casseliflavus]